ncbi:hypothetical protein ILUMI_03766 [Ignelater luminosus]|uniref:Uncharacterized protein n=1 Tax=Ignelater luminosus TaxID=2038154 RepID=A0A8K0DDW2_IGNLU|nr:hypothetical protein ILUMI_03766 [Ignelater luminosus]
MLKVNKCCFCFDLKYGFITYATVLLIFRIAAIMVLWDNAYLDKHISSNLNMQTNLTMPAIGYLAATVVVVFIALKGIINERSILMYPYLVVCVLELTLTTASHLWAVFIISAWYLIYLVIGGGIEFYVFICLLSLYNEIKERERNGRQRDSVEEDIALKA